MDTLGQEFACSVSLVNQHSFQPDPIVFRLCLVHRRRALLFRLQYGSRLIQCFSTMEENLFDLVRKFHSLGLPLRHCLTLFSSSVGSIDFSLKQNQQSS